MKTKQNKMLALVFGAMLFIGSLSGCGNAPKQGSQQDYDEAEETLDQYIEAVIDGDERTIRKLSDYKSGIPWTAVNYNLSAEDAESTLQSDSLLLKTSSRYKNAYIEKGEQDIEALEYYNAFLDYLKQSDDAVNTEYLNDSPEITYLYSFPVSLNDKIEETFDVAKIDGEWKVLLCWMDDMRKTSQFGQSLESANSIAKSVYIACNTTLVDMDISDLYLPEEGIMRLNGSDFNIKEPDSSLKTSDPEYIKQYFLSSVAKYYPQIIHVGEIRIEIRDGSCEKAAIQSGSGRDPYTEKKKKSVFFGCYPDAVTEESNKQAKDIDDII